MVPLSSESSPNALHRCFLPRAKCHCNLEPESSLCFPRHSLVSPHTTVVESGCCSSHFTELQRWVTGKRFTQWVNGKARTWACLLWLQNLCPEQMLLFLISRKPKKSANLSWLLLHSNRTRHEWVLSLAYEGENGTQPTPCQSHSPHSLFHCHLCLLLKTAQNRFPW